MIDILGSYVVEASVKSRMKRRVFIKLSFVNPPSSLPPKGDIIGLT